MKDEAKNEECVIYTDGGSRGNPGIGGWGAFVTCGSSRQELSGTEDLTTNNRMELTAAIEGLKSMDDSQIVSLYTDSTYVKDGITKWITNWKSNGWKTAAKKPVKNKDLWIALDEQVNRLEVEWHWVKGHDGHEGNERADELCNEAMDGLELR